MARRIRVKLSPLSSGLGDAGQTIADGATVSFVTFGSGGSVLKPDAPAPAKLTFEARFIERIRDADSEVETRTLATLEGNIRASKDVAATLRFEGKLGDDGKPSGLIPDPAAVPDPPPAASGQDSGDGGSEDESEVRIFRFAFDPGQFSKAAPTADPTPLRVRVDPSRFRYCEISATLEIDGQPEGDGTANDILDVLITSHNPAVAPQEARRVRLVGLLFDADKTFLLPQALPGIKVMVEMHQNHPDAKLLAVGHAAGDEVLAGGNLALARAQSLRAYLTHDVDVWHKQFGTNTPERSRWGTREVQIMLSVVPEGAPLYKDFPSGVTNAKTTSAIKAFQESKGLVADGKVGPKTLKALLDAYMTLEGTTLEKGTQVVVCGCDGHVDDDPSKDGGEVDDRRVELFLFERKIAPAPSAPVLQAANAEFTAWRSALVESSDFENHGIHAQILDANNKPVPQAEVKLTGPISADSTTDDHGFVSFFDLVPGDYELTAKREGFQGTQKLHYPTGKTVAGISAATTAKAKTA